MFSGIRNFWLTLAAATLIGAAMVPIAVAAFMPLAPAPASLQADDVAVVEGVHISLAEFETVFKLVETQFQRKLTSEEKVKTTATVMSSLTERRWYEIEGVALGAVVSDAAAQRRLDRLIGQTFPNMREYQLFLKHTGQTEQDLLALIRGQLFAEFVTKPWVGSVVITDDQVAAEHRDNGAKYDLPASRDIRVVFTKSKSKAQAARAALDAGRSFKAVAKQYSSDRASKRRGGKMPGIVRGQFSRKLDRAVFAAKKHKLQGPLKTKFGFYVFEVTKITPKQILTLQEATPAIRKGLKTTQETANAKQAKIAFNAKWTAATLCRSGYVATVCGAYAP